MLMVIVLLSMTSSRDREAVFEVKPHCHSGIMKTWGGGGTKMLR